MPEDSTGCVTVLEFLVLRFPGIAPDIWRQRIRDGKVQWQDGTPIGQDSAYTPKARILYYREVVQEPVIPFQETIIHQDENLLVVDKPHFLPVTPGSVYVNQCLLYRLRKQTGIHDLTPIHRIDRWTAGIVLFSTGHRARGPYQELFANEQVTKLYHGIAQLTAGNDGPLAVPGQEWQVENRIATGNPSFRMTVVQGEINARSRIRCIATESDRGLFHLHPLTGKTHQLRLHMSGLGMPLLNERYYPELQPQSPDNFERPLQLLAKQLEFLDPLTREPRHFISRQNLDW
jgi:tRNA pseudouridine32 synthase / 23S rRNA pseudouridine746 synthase